MLFLQREGQRNATQCKPVEIPNTLEKVFDRQHQRIRSIWPREGVYYAPMDVLGQTKRIPLPTADSIAKGLSARQDLKTKLLPTSTFRKSSTAGPSRLTHSGNCHNRVPDNAGHPAPDGRGYGEAGRFVPDTLGAIRASPVFQPDEVRVLFFYSHLRINYG